MIGTRLLAEDLSVLLLQLRGGQAAEALDLLADLGFVSPAVNQQSHEGSLSGKSTCGLAGAGKSRRTSASPRMAETS